MQQSNSKHYTRIARIVGVLVVLVGGFVVGVYYGYQNRPEVEKITTVINKEQPATTQAPADFDPFWKAYRSGD